MSEFFRFVVVDFLINYLTTKLKTVTKSQGGGRAPHYAPGNPAVFIGPPFLAAGTSQHTLNAVLDLVKPTGYVMHQQVQSSTTLRFAHTVLICFVFI
jgi:hypothetical protein